MQTEQASRKGHRFLRPPAPENLSPKLIDPGLVPRVEAPDTQGTFPGGVPREQTMLKGHLPRVIYHQVYWYTKIIHSSRLNE